MSMINVLMIIVGLSMCFGGLYFRKIFAGLISFCWSLLLGTLFLLVALFSGNIEISTGIIIIGTFSIACTVISVIYDRICVAINSFMNVFSVLLVILLLLISDFDNRFLWIALAVMISLIPAVISYYFYHWAFILNTAFTGGFIASVGFYGLFLDIDVSKLDGKIIGGNSDFLFPILAGTFVLGCFGTFVQYQKLKKIQSSSSDSKSYFTMGCVTDGGIDIVEKIRNSEIILDLNSEKLCLLLCLIGFVILPLANDQILWSGTLFGIFVNKAYFIFERVAIAGVIYFAYNKKIKSGVVYCMPFLMVHIITMGNLFRYTTGIIQVVEPFLVLMVSFLLQRVLKTDFKYLCSILFVIFYRYLLFRWVDYHGVYWSITIYDIAPIIGLVVALTLLVYIRNRKNIWDVASYINQISRKQTVTNKEVAIIVVCIIMVAFGGVLIRNYFVEKQEYANSAAGYHEKGEEENQQASSDISKNRAEDKEDSSDSSRNDEEVSNDLEHESSGSEEMIAILTAESWEVYCAYNDIDEDVFIGDIYGFWMINCGANYLNFGDDGHFTLCLGDFTSEYDDGEMTGIYECEGNMITLYSELSDIVLELEYTNLDYQGRDAMSLLWYDDITEPMFSDDTVEYYRVYFVNPSFYQ